MDAHFRAGQEATRAGQAERAIQEYREVLRLSPGLTEARVNLGLDYFMAGQYQQASVELKRARQEKPHVVAANLFLGMAYLKLGFPANAIPPLEEVLRQDPANQQALPALAACYLRRDNYLDATKVYLQLFAANADPVEGWYALGQNYLAMAKQLSDEISIKSPNTSWEARLAADVLAEEQRWVDAAAQYRRALALEANAPGLHVALGNMLLRQDDVNDAQGEYRAELHRDAKSEEALLGLAATDLAQGNASLAIGEVAKIWEVFPAFLESQTDFPLAKIATAKLAALARELASAPDSPARQFLLASLDRAAGLNEEATQEWSKFLSSLHDWSRTQKTAGGQPEPMGVACAAHHYAQCAQLIRSQKARSPEQNMVLGRALVTLGEDRGAATAFAEALNGAPANAASRYWLMRSCQRLALTSFSHLMQSAPDSWRVHEIQGEYYQIRLDYKKATEEFNAALVAQPNSAELHEELGAAYLLDKNAVAGKAEIQTALQLDPTRTLSLFLLGRVCFQNREVPQSIEYFQGALRYDPSFLPARAALGRAYMRVGKPASAVPELEKAASTDYSGDLHYLLSTAYRELGKPGLAAQALAVSQDLRKKSAERHQAGVAAAEEELADQ